MGWVLPTLLAAGDRPQCECIGWRETREEPSVFTQGHHGTQDRPAVLSCEHMHLSQSLGTLMCSPRPSGPAFPGLLVIYPSFLRTHLSLVAEPGLSHSLNGRVFRGLAFFFPLRAATLERDCLGLGTGGVLGKSL